MRGSGVWRRGRPRFNELAEVHHVLNVTVAILPNAVGRLWRRSTVNGFTATAARPDALTDISGGAALQRRAVILLHGVTPRAVSRCINVPAFGRSGFWSEVSSRDREVSSEAEQHKPEHGHADTGRDEQSVKRRPPNESVVRTLG